MTDLTVYRYALFLRGLIYKKLRHDENPFDSRFPWDASDEKVVAELMVFLHLEVSSEFGSPRFYPQVLEAIQKLVNNYNQVDIRNLPPPDVIAAYESHLREMEQVSLGPGQEARQTVKKELHRRAASALPQVDPQTLDYIVTTIVADATEIEVQESVPQAYQIIFDTATVTGQEVSTEAALATVSAAAPLWNSTSPNFTTVHQMVGESLAVDQSPEDEVAESAVSFTTDYISTAIFSPSSSTTPSPQFESSAVTTTQSPPIAAKAAQILTSRQGQISSLVSQLRQALSESSQIEKEIYKQLSLNPDLNKADLPQTFIVVQRFVLPLVTAAHTAAAQAGVPAEKIKPLDKFLEHIGYRQGLKELGITNVSASARMAAEKAVANLDLTQLLNSPASTQVFYSARTTSSPRMRAFLQDLSTLETMDFASVAAVADKHFDLSSLDASLDKYFENPDIRTYVRMQNFAGDVVARFIPAARPIIAILKPLNKLLFLVVERLPVIKALRSASKILFGVGAVSGVAAIYLGALAHRVFVALRAIPVKATAIISAAGAAVLTTFASFLTITFIVFLSIPVAVALILFIINNSAYIVPQAVGIISGGVSPAGCNLQCLQFSGFSASEQSQMEAAACTILANSCFASSLCAGGPITIARVNRNVGYCGEQTGTKEISVYDGGVDGSKCSGLYTLSHELGHVFSSLNPSYGTSYATTVLPRRSSCLPTYELYYQKDPVLCQKEKRTEFPDGHVEIEIVSGGGEDMAEILAQYFINPGLLANYPPQNELAQKTLASPACSQSSSSVAYVLEGNLGDIVISKPSDIGSPSPACSWSARNTPSGGAVNANYFFVDTDDVSGKRTLVPVGWAGDPTLSTYRCGNACASLFFNGTSIQPISDRQTGGSRPSKAVSGLSLDAAADQKTNRTALGIKGNTVYLVVVPNATATQLKLLMSQLGTSQTLQLDGGSSSTICQGGSLKYGSNATVPVSIGLRNATLSTYDLP